ncbi:hypothetical protein ACIRP0_31510 [Streptomyces sp. NPDC101733]|uniref:hypothetical protein n=1 Tax=unclassified Streptomyces TaxID=2593676 RepID=UPI003825A991
MQSTLWTLTLAALTAVVTSVAVGLLVTPRLEARKRRIQEVHTARDTFSSSVLTILTSCGRLRDLPLPPDGDPATTGNVRTRLESDRERWLQQLDDATMWMIDHLETFALSWPSARLRNLAGRYVVASRMTVLSDREESTKIEILLDLTAPIQGIFFTRWWHRARHLHRYMTQLEGTLGRLTAPDPTPPPVAPAA